MASLTGIIEIGDLTMDILFEGEIFSEIDEISDWYVGYYCEFESTILHVQEGEDTVPTTLEHKALFTKYVAENYTEIETDLINSEI